jgi:hypothetical protein
MKAAEVQPFWVERFNVWKFRVKVIRFGQEAIRPASLKA